MEFVLEFTELKKKFEEDKEQLFNNPELLKDGFKFCVNYSLLVEEYIVKLAANKNFSCVLVSAGSFSRRELSPYSDIDIMFIFPSADEEQSELKRCVTLMWDAGIEVSHTVRDFNDIEKFINTDLHTYTQFFETRYLIGDENTYNEWNKKLIRIIDKMDKEKLLNDFLEDINKRHLKYGDSSKVLEPNIKNTAGGLRDFHALEWMYAIKNKQILTKQNEIVQTENFLSLLSENGLVNQRGKLRLLKSYNLLLTIRNNLHLLKKRKDDRLEFGAQEKLAEILGYGEGGIYRFMHDYFEASTSISRFSKTLMKRFKEEIIHPISDYLSIDLDDDFSLKGSVIFIKKKKLLSLSEIMRVFYYRGLHDAIFEQNLRSLIIESVLDIEEHENMELTSSVFFREILKLPKNVGKVLSTMNEFGVLGIYLPEFKELIGFFQPGVYHCYTADEHTIIAIKNLEKLNDLDTALSRIYKTIIRKDILYLAMLFHDIAKPISISGHEILGAEIANSIVEKLGYESEVNEMVQFLVKNHLLMEQVAFRRNLNDPSTLNGFASIFQSLDALDLLYLVTYADLSAVSPAIWTEWKSDLLYELYSKTKSMLEQQLTAEELLYDGSLNAISESDKSVSSSVKEHIKLIDDLGYLVHYSKEEINKHVQEIEKGSEISVFFKEETGFTNISIITKDSESLLSKLTGALSINDLNIRNAKIFTRKDGIIIDSFNVSDFRTDEKIDQNRYKKIEEDLRNVLNGSLQVTKEFRKVKSKWWRIEQKLFKRKGRVKINFEEHSKYTIIDIYSPDRLGLLFQITKKMYELGLTIYYAKISTKADDIIDSFYALDRFGNKISENDYELIRIELTNAIEQML